MPWITLSTYNPPTIFLPRTYVKLYHAIAFHRPTRRIISKFSGDTLLSISLNPVQVALDQQLLLTLPSYPLNPFTTMTTPPSPSESSLATSIFSLPSKPQSETETKNARTANWRFPTLCAAVDTKDQYGSSSTPIYQTATFKGMDGPYDYTRSGNPTRGGLGELVLFVLLFHGPPSLIKNRNSPC